MIQNLKGSIRRGRLYPISHRVIEPFELRRWRRRDFSGPTPDAFKSRLLTEYARKFATPILVETGTYLGRMIVATHKHFKKVVSIELDPTLHANARMKFKNWSNVELIEGDSGDVLAARASSWTESCLFWLDAHYCGPSTALGAEEAPLFRELEAIFRRPANLLDVILIDDAREFLGGKGYPRLDAVLEFVNKNRPNWETKVENDIIQCFPRKA